MRALYSLTPGETGATSIRRRGTMTSGSPSGNVVSTRRRWHGTVEDVKQRVILGTAAASTAFVPASRMARAGLLVIALALAGLPPTAMSLGTWICDRCTFAPSDTTQAVITNAIILTASFPRQRRSAAPRNKRPLEYAAPNGEVTPRRRQLLYRDREPCPFYFPPCRALRCTTPQQHYGLSTVAAAAPPDGCQTNTKAEWRRSFDVPGP
ncbi:hypothetical protein HPB51_016375 [Rhipicephalus microplus]|uniref:Uncharacterized protein n=1 Tax=Rhipicephalus microplus TaxID=6941 RepID=A0A9J6DHX8_RHIMP|nr:hypothetical protein HPB51_016375 [Rhipicephalus microplus]